MGEDPAAIREEIEHTRERMGTTVDAIGYKADVPARARDTMSDRVQGVKEKVVGAREQVSNAIAGAGGEVSDAIAGARTQVAQSTPDAGDVRQAGRQAVGVAQENPLGLAIGAAAAGFLAGMLIPSTRVEHEQLGPVADEVKRQVRQTGHEAIDRGRQVVEETAQTAAQSAQRAAAEVRDHAQQSAQAQTQEMKESAQDSVDEVRRTASS